METMRFDHLTVRFDERVLRPRPWTRSQSLWAAELAAGLPPGPCLDLCAGVGHGGLLLASLVPRDLVLVDADPTACQYARDNVAAAALPQRVEVRLGDIDAVLAPDERFAIILADPPWVPSQETWRFPADPLHAIDGGPDGLEGARTCVEVIGRHLAPGGVAILQLRDEQQVRGIRAHLDDRPTLGLSAGEVRVDPDGNGVLVELVVRS
jgi:release factor glutamine methyltransferase